MGRLTQFFAFMEADKTPTEQEKKYHFTHLELKEWMYGFRRKFRKEQKKSK